MSPVACGPIPAYSELAGLLHSDVEASDGEQSFPLRISALSDRSSVGPFESFAIELEGAAAPPLDQGTFMIRPAQRDSFELFVTPIAERDGVRTYEAVVTRSPL